MLRVKIQTRFIPFVALAVLALLLALWAGLLRNDNIFRNGGDQLLLNLQADNTNGYTGSMNIGLDLTDIQVGASDTAGGPPP